jgi:glutamate dehydrogenase (NADP+)
VNLSILKFLAFEQTFKNALTTLPMGGGKGGSDFDPKGKSPGEVMRFCQAFVTELFRHVGADTDVPAGDIGVGGREVGFMAGMMKKLSNRADCVFTGKGLSFGGSLIRPEATGYGTVYFAEEMLKQKGRPSRACASACRARATWPSTRSKRPWRWAPRSSPCPTPAAPWSTRRLHARQAGRADGGEEPPVRPRQRLRQARRRPFLPGVRPWQVPVDVALPCATQNELDGDDAKTLVANGVMCVAEGANMPSTLEAVKLFEDSGVLYAPGKASNAGGVATSGLEMSQNAMRLSWGRDEVDARLHGIMRSIHEACLHHGRRADGSVSYVDGANVAGFVKVAEAACCHAGAGRDLRSSAK